ncbi:IS66 family insertion sequence element accessory protein TnpB [Thalassomonas actiniarum]|uniref:IS66 family insertion sequence element accessory protein TnpB n=1 Tax=Thalassomonas actiniarum TaxID=485447 RepID=A0AAE9YRT7_9GAMM|nr:IS66 family insertion sequence element accessory protein TnpB [Thalassomonas actiniarum]
MPPGLYDGACRAANAANAVHRCHFIFRNKSRNKMKILYRDITGFAL